MSNAGRSKALDRMTGALYRVGLRHEDGASSVLSLAGRPVRLAVGEAAASAADAMVNATKSRVDHRTVGAKRPLSWVPGDVGPSTL
jgi:hypothetical protein